MNEDAQVKRRLLRLANLIPVLSLCSLACRPSVPVKIDEITLERRSAWGESSQYQIVLRRDGTATYIGRQNVQKIGTFEAKLTQSEFQRLEEMVNRIGYFEMSDDDFLVPVDTDQIKTSVLRAGIRKTFDDNVGSTAP